MTHDEADRIDSLRKEVRDYHVEVTAYIARSKMCRADVERMLATMYGTPGQEGAHPGVVGELAAERQLTKTRHRILWAVWGLVTAAAGALAKAYFDGTL